MSTRGPFVSSTGTRPQLKTHNFANFFPNFSAAFSKAGMTPGRGHKRSNQVPGSHQGTETKPQSTTRSPGVHAYQSCSVTSWRTTRADSFASYLVLPVPALHRLVVRSSGEGDLWRIKNAPEMAAQFHSGGSATVAAAVIGSNHCIQRNDGPGHDGVQEVIEVFPEEEPSGVDVRSHLCNKGEATVAPAVMQKPAFRAPCRPAFTPTLGTHANAQRPPAEQSQPSFSTNCPAGKGRHLYHNIKKHWKTKLRCQQIAGTLKGNSAVIIIGILITSM